jgi:hypothetical protein
MFLPHLRERVLGWGKGTSAVSAASALDSVPENRPKGRIALSHLSFQTFVFAGGHRLLGFRDLRRCGAHQESK